VIEVVNNLYAAALPSFKEINTFTGFVQEVYTFALAIVGIAVFIQFIRAGFGYLTAAGNTSKTQKSKEIMTNAVAGAILLLSAVLILMVINPDLAANSFDEDVLRGLDPTPVTRRTLSHAQAHNLLVANGIEVESGVSLHGMRQATITRVIAFKNICGGCDFQIQHGTEKWPNGDVIELNSDTKAMGYVTHNYVLEVRGKWYTDFETQTWFELIYGNDLILYVEHKVWPEDHPNAQHFKDLRTPSPT